MTLHERDVALRALCFALVAVWLSKWDFFAAAARVYVLRPLDDPFFPPILQSFWVLAAAFCAPPAVALFALALAGYRASIVALGAFAGGSLVLLGHQGSYNDATFVCSLWVALAGLWLAHAEEHPEASLAQRAAFFAQAVIALQFLGGAIGKLTPGYLDGSVLHGIYFADRDHFTFALSREWLDPASLQTAARYYSRTVIALELALASLPLWPAKPALWTAVIGLSALAIFHNFRLFSVVGSLIALAATALWLERAHEKRVEPCVELLDFQPAR